MPTPTDGCRLFDIANLIFRTTQYETFTASWGHQEWLSILRLASLWEMTEVRTQAIRRLDKLDSFPSPIAKLFCGKEFKYDPWVRAGIQTLVSRTEPLSEEEGNELGMKDTIRCAAAREMIRRVDHR